MKEISKTILFSGIVLWLLTSAALSHRLDLVVERCPEVVERSLEVVEQSPEVVERSRNHHNSNDYSHSYTVLVHGVSLAFLVSMLPFFSCSTLESVFLCKKPYLFDRIHRHKLALQAVSF